MTLEELQLEADKLATEMRKINIRSWGLKPRIHDDWCERARMISDGLNALEPKKVPPSPPSKISV